MSPGAAPFLLLHVLELNVIQLFKSTPDGAAHAHMAHRSPDGVLDTIAQLAPQRVICFDLTPTNPNQQR